MSEVRESRSYRRIVSVAVPLTSLVLVLAGGESQASAAPIVKKVQSVSVIPDFSKLTKGGKSCEGGYPRPCYQPLYKSPREERPLAPSDIVNAYMQSGNTAKVIWPYEAKDNPGGGDRVEVVCQVRGETIHNALHDSTRIWDVIRVPSSKLNSAALTEAETSNPGFGVEKEPDGSVEAVYAYASSMWLGDTVYHDLRQCSPTENPQGYQAA